MICNDVHLKTIKYLRTLRFALHKNITNIFFISVF